MQTFMTLSPIRRAALLAIALLFGAAACDNPVRGGDHEEAVEGVSIRNGATEVARYFEGEVTGALPNVVEGQQGPELTVVFLDHDGEPLDFSGEEEHSLRATPANASIATFAVSGYGGRVSGLSEGSTTIIFDLMHGTHADFSTLGIPVTVLSAP